MLRFTIWYRKLVRFIKKCFSLVLFRSDSFTFILIWSGVVYLWMHLPNYPNILLGVLKVRWLGDYWWVFPSILTFWLKTISHVINFGHICCRQAQIHAGTADYSCLNPQVANFAISANFEISAAASCLVGTNSCVDSTLF